ncbi:MAG: T9SS type A sorting domain-containing protein [Myroides sp.]
MGAYIRGGSTYSVFFSPTDSIPPFPANPEAYKRTYLAKYDSYGGFVWKKALQGSVTQANTEAYIHDIVMDSQNKLHFIVGFAAGTHLDGLVTVPVTFTNYTYQYYLVKFNTATQQFDDVLLLPMTGRLEQEGKMRFAYDENSNIYYLAGMQAGNISAPPTPLSYGGDAFVERSFILAFNGFNSTTGIDGGEVWRREIYSQAASSSSVAADNMITSLLIDTDSNVYIAGRLWANKVNNTPEPIKIYDPSDTQVAPYIFTPGIDYKIPALIKLDGTNGTVQWAKTPTAYAANRTTGAYTEVKGLVFRGNEIALGTGTAYFIWDNFVQNPAQFHAPDPALMRFNKQTANTVGMHTIESPADYSGYITAVAVDNDGNYVTGGAFYTTLFTNNANVNQLVSSGGNDFFVAKLAASVCGTPVSTDKFNKLNVNVYPNPTTDIVNIETQETLHNYEMYNVLGQQIQKGMFGNNNQINLHGVVVGTYFIKVTTTQGSTATVKVIKK